MRWTCLTGLTDAVLFDDAIEQVAAFWLFFRVKTASGDRSKSGIDGTELTPNERFVAKQMVLNLRALTTACIAAPDGPVMVVAEKLVIEQGREAIRKALLGDGTLAATACTDQMRTTILKCGWNGFDERRREARNRLPADSPQIAALNGLRNSPGYHVAHRNYAEWLREGRSIGSGQFEETCKTLIGCRLKHTAARWRPSRLNRIVSLCSAMYSQQWTAWWNHHAV